MVIEKIKWAMYQIENFMVCFIGVSTGKSPFSNWLTIYSKQSGTRKWTIWMNNFYFGYRRVISQYNDGKFLES